MQCAFVWQKNSKLTFFRWQSLWHWRSSMNSKTVDIILPSALLKRDKHFLSLWLLRTFSKSLNKNSNSPIAHHYNKYFSSSKFSKSVLDLFVWIGFLSNLCLRTRLWYGPKWFYGQLCRQPPKIKYQTAYSPYLYHKDMQLCKAENQLCSWFWYYTFCCSLRENTHSCAWNGDQ